MIRVTGGKFRNRQVKTVKTQAVRPTSSKVRESIFNILQGRVVGSSMLDLFAGSGIMGIEALSRGAEKVTFVEKNPKVYKLLKENLSNFDTEYKVFLTDALSALAKLKGAKFDIIFADPPYKLDIIPYVLQKIKNNDLLAQEGVLVLEHSPDCQFDSTGFEVVKTKVYGDTALTLLKLQGV